MRRVVGLASWAFLVWVLLTWTPRVEQVAFGVGLSVLVAVGLAPLGPVGGPWRLLHPRRLAALGRLVPAVVGQVARANVTLAARVWRPARPVRSGMLLVHTDQRTAGGLTAVGVLTSLVVDNQLVDLDRGRHELQYHTVAVPEGDARAATNGPVEGPLSRLTGEGGPT